MKIRMRKVNISNNIFSSPSIKIEGHRASRRGVGIWMFEGQPVPGLFFKKVSKSRFDVHEIFKEDKWIKRVILPI